MRFLGVSPAGDAAPVACGEDEFLGVAGVSAAGAQSEVGLGGVEDGGQHLGVDGE